jgi:hypothetical protein
MMMSNLKIWKAISEVRYPPAATLFDNRGRIAAAWQFHDDLSEWRIANNQVVIYNPSKSRLLMAGFANSAISEELPRNYRLFSDLAADFSCQVIETLQIQKISRLGIRLVYMAERKGFKGLVRKIGKRLYRLEDEEWEIFGGFPEDIGFPLTLKLGQYKANFRFGPMEKEEYKQENLFESESTLEKVPSVSIFIDFDLYRLDPTGNSPESLIRDFLDEGGTVIEGIVAKFSEHFGEF